MEEVVWNKIAESSNGNYSTYYASIESCVAIRTLIDEKELINFIPNYKKNCDWELEEL